MQRFAGCSSHSMDSRMEEARRSTLLVERLPPQCLTVSLCTKGHTSHDALRCQRNDERNAKQPDCSYMVHGGYHTLAWRDGPEIGGRGAPATFLFRRNASDTVAARYVAPKSPFFCEELQCPAWLDEALRSLPPLVSRSATTTVALSHFRRPTQVSVERGRRLHPGGNPNPKPWVALAMGRGC